MDAMPGEPGKDNEEARDHSHARPPKDRLSDARGDTPQHRQSRDLVKKYIYIYIYKHNYTYTYIYTT